MAKNIVIRGVRKVPEMMFDLEKYDGEFHPSTLLTDCVHRQWNSPTENLEDLLFAECVINYLGVDPRRFTQTTIDAIEEKAKQLGDGLIKKIGVTTTEIATKAGIKPVWLFDQHGNTLDNFDVASRVAVSMPCYALFTFDESNLSAMEQAFEHMDLSLASHVQLVEAVQRGRWASAKAAAMGAAAATAAFGRRMLHAYESVPVGVKTLIDISGAVARNVLLDGSSPTAHASGSAISAHQEDMATQNDAVIPSAYADYFKASEPHFMTKALDGAISTVMRHSELLTTIKANAGKIAEEFSLNPGLPSTMPWGHLIASQFEQYEFKKLLYTFIPALGTGTAGTIALGTDFDPRDVGMDTTAEVLNSAGATVSSVYRPISHDPSEELFKTQKRKFVRTGHEPLSQVRAADVGKFNFVLDGTQTLPVGTPIGLVTVAYEVDLFAAQSADEDVEVGTDWYTYALAANVIHSQAASSGTGYTFLPFEDFTAGIGNVFPVILGVGSEYSATHKGIIMPRGIYRVKATFLVRVNAGVEIAWDHDHSSVDVETGAVTALSSMAFQGRLGINPKYVGPMAMGLPPQVQILNYGGTIISPYATKVTDEFFYSSDRSTALRLSYTFETSSAVTVSWPSQGFTVEITPV
jgi:hypothetical protein